MLARGSFPKAVLILEFSEGPLIQQHMDDSKKAWQANEKPAIQGAWGAKQEMWVLVLGLKSLSDLGPVFEFLWSSVLLSGK